MCAHLDLYIYIYIMDLSLLQQMYAGIMMASPMPVLECMRPAVAAERVILTVATAEGDQI